MVKVCTLHTWLFLTFYRCLLIHCYRLVILSVYYRYSFSVWNAELTFSLDDLEYLQLITSNYRYPQLNYRYLHVFLKILKITFLYLQLNVFDISNCFSRDLQDSFQDIQKSFRDLKNSYRDIQNLLS